MAAHSIVLPSTLSPHMPSITSKPKPLASALSFRTSSLSIKHLSLSFPLSRNARFAGSGIVRNVAMSSELEQEETEEEGDANFSPDLKLFVGNLPFNVDSAKLAGLFESAGTVEMVEVIYDKQTGQSRGFGFVTMSTVEEVEAAAQQFNGYELGGRALRVNSGPPPPKDDFSPRGGFRSGGGGGGGGSVGSGNRVYVGNLSWGVDNLALENLFNEQGRVMEAKVVYDRESGRSRGFGFVTLSSSQEVNNAISSLDGAELDGRRIRVTVAEERPRRQF